MKVMCVHDLPIVLYCHSYCRYMSVLSHNSIQFGYVKKKQKSISLRIERDSVAVVAKWRRHVCDDVLARYLFVLQYCVDVEMKKNNLELIAKWLVEARIE